MNPFRTQLSQSGRYWLSAILVTGFLFRVAVVIILDLQPESDQVEYASMALNLLGGKGIIDSAGNRAMYNVGYPLFVLTPIFWLAGYNLLAAQFMNAVLGAIAIALCYAIAKESGAGRIGSLMAAAMWALYVPSSVYAEYLAKENLMTPLMLGVTWCALRMIKDVSFIVAVACGVLFGLLALTGNAALSFALPVAVAIGLAPGGLGRKLSGASLAVTAALMVAAPWMVRNYFVLGAPVLNTNGGFNLYLGNNPAATGYFVPITETPRGPTWRELKKNGEVEASEALRDEAVTWIKNHPKKFLSLVIKKAALFWMPPVHEGNGQVSRIESFVRILWLVQFAVLAAGPVASLLFFALRTRFLGILWLCIGTYTSVHMLFYVIFRYREPIMPLLCVFAGLVFEQLWSRCVSSPHFQNSTASMIESL